MQTIFKSGELIIAQEARASEPYGGTPLGVEAAWCLNGMDLRPGAGATETPMRPTES